MLLTKLGVSAFLLLALLPRALAQSGAAAPGPEELVVTLPPAIVALWEPGLSEVVCFAVDERVASADQHVESRLRVSTPRAAQIDKLLLIGGAHCRWAFRGADGSFRWDDSGHVLAFRLPSDLGPAYTDWPRPLRCYADMLGPADGQAPTGVAELYPTMSMYRVEDERFVIGVPGPGRWTASFHGDGGGAPLLATCEAVLESAVGDELPVADVRTFACRVRFEFTAPLAEEKLELKVKKLTRGGSTGWAVLNDRGDGTFEFELSPSDMRDTAWISLPGWEVQRVDGEELTALDTTITRFVRPARTLRVLVHDAAGKPVPQASVDWRDRADQRVPAVWTGTSIGETFFWWGKTGPDGEALTSGAPPEHAHALRASAKGWQHSRVVIDWEGSPEIVEIILSAD